MQLARATPAPGVRQRIGAAACLLLAGSLPAAAQTSGPKWQLDATTLAYGEEGRARVVEPTGRITRLFSNGRSLSAQFAVDAMTGASPTGALPSGLVQTTTSASGTVSTATGHEIPTQPFQDLRGAFDLTGTTPIGNLLTTSAAAHYSREKDYQSVGGSARASLDLMSRLTTLTVGGGYNRDGVFPTGGTPPGLAPDTVLRISGANPKDVVTGLIGVSRVLNRRWLVGVTASRSRENGYLTDPYKVVSLLDSLTQRPVGQVTEKRPSTRLRTDLLASSVNHMGRDVLYLNYRYYWDDWDIHSHTYDLRLRHDLSDGTWVQPHLRFYQQTRAQFFVFGLIHGPPLPEYASADDRLGPLRTATIGGTYGFRLGHSGEFTMRAEFLYQWVEGRPQVPVAGETPGVDEARLEQEGGEGGASPHAGTMIGTVLAGYTIQF